MFAKTASLVSIEKKSKAIKDVFTKTKEDSLALCGEIKALAQNKQDLIARLQEEVTSLEGIATGHSKLAEKIDSFLNA